MGDKDGKLSQEEADRAGLSSDEFKRIEKKKDGVIDIEEAEMSGISRRDFELMDEDKNAVVDEGEFIKAKVAEKKAAADATSTFDNISKLDSKNRATVAAGDAKDAGITEEQFKRMDANQDEVV